MEATDEWVSINEAAKWLKLHHQTIRKAINSGDLIAHQPGGPGSPWRIHRRALHAWVARGQSVASRRKAAHSIVRRNGGAA